MFTGTGAMGWRGFLFEFLPDVEAQHRDHICKEEKYQEDVESEVVAPDYECTDAEIPSVFDELFHGVQFMVT